MMHATKMNQPFFISWINSLLDKHFWNEQSEVIAVLFPQAEEDHPEALYWFELKDSTPAHVRELEALGAAILRLGTHAWIGFPAGAESQYSHLQQLGMHH